jgi:hypothetical protein
LSGFTLLKDILLDFNSPPVIFSLLLSN